jgi:poly(3-hydroxybutyrate) depolymerase
MRSKSLLFLFVLFALAQTSAFDGQLQRFEVQAAGLIRTYLVYTPGNLTEPAPVVFAFHGGGGTAWGMLSLTHFDTAAEANGFLLVLPQGRRLHWNDGRKAGTGSEANDIAFFDAMLSRIEGSYSIDKHRIYLTGMSNGAIFAHHLAAQRAAEIAAIAPVAGAVFRRRTGQISSRQRRYRSWPSTERAIRS